DRAAAGGRQVVVPVRMGRRAGLGGEYVDRVGVLVVGQVHHRRHEFPAGLASAMVQQRDRRALELTTHLAVVGAELGYHLGVPVDHFGHRTLLFAGSKVITLSTNSPAQPCWSSTASASGGQACAAQSPNGRSASAT